MLREVVDKLSFCAGGLKVTTIGSWVEQRFTAAIRAAMLTGFKPLRSHSLWKNALA